MSPAELAPDAIVVGSGPSGVALAAPLLEGGMRVTMLDGGRQRTDALVPRGAYHDLRREDPAQWRLFLGQDLESLRSAGPPSPKFQAPASRFAFEGYLDAERVIGSDFTVIGSLARGGFSTIWGAGLGVYDEDDLAEFPLGVEELAPSFVRVAHRIGVSGFGDDDLATALDPELAGSPELRMAESCRDLLLRYSARRREVQALGVRMGRPRIAVLTEDRPGRAPCALCDACLWGCRHGSIWSATHDLATLQQHPGFRYRPGVIVERLVRGAAGPGVVVRPEQATTTAPPQTLSAPRVLLAAGTLSTTRLALSLQGRFDEPLALHSSPTAGFALLLPGRLGKAISTRDYSMAQLSFTDGNGRDRSYGNLFPASGLPASFLIERMPLTRPGAVRLQRLLQPALIVGNCFLPGQYAHATVRLERGDDATQRLVVRGEVPGAQRTRFALLEHRLRAAFRRLGAWMLPSSFTIAGPGSDLRYCGTFPMRASPGPGEVDRSGELHGFPGFHLVDLSIFPAMGGKHPTFALMANADRIGREIVAEWRRGAGREHSPDPIG